MQREGIVVASSVSAKKDQERYSVICLIPETDTTLKKILGTTEMRSKMLLQRNSMHFNHRTRSLSALVLAFFCSACTTEGVSTENLSDTSSANPSGVTLLKSACGLQEERDVIASQTGKLAILDDSVTAMGPRAVPFRNISFAPVGDNDMILYAGYIRSTDGAVCNHILKIGSGRRGFRVKQSYPTADFEGQLPETQRLALAEMRHACALIGPGGDVNVFPGGERFRDIDGSIISVGFSAINSCEDGVPNNMASVDIHYGRRVVRITTIWDKIFVSEVKNGTK